MKQSGVSDANRLHDIIRVQSEIASLGYDLGAIMLLATQRIRTLTGARDAIIELAEGDEMVYRAAAGPAESKLGLRLKQRGSLSGLCVEREEILTCHDSRTDERVDAQACALVGVRSMVVTPLKHNNATVGVVKIAADTPSAFDDGEVQTLALLSDMIAAAMYHATKLRSDELYHLATHDPLTGIGNRALFYDRLRQCLSCAGRQPNKSGVVILDMDGLKPINDCYGHHAGDEAIRTVASRIRDTLRQSDTVARLGGDEFGVVLNNVDSADDALTLIDRVVDSIRQPFYFNKQELPLNASAGFAIAPDDGADVEILVAEADRRMYDVKKSRQPRRGISCEGL